MASGQDGTSGKCPANPAASRLVAVLWFVRESAAPKFKPSILLVKHAASEILFLLRLEKTFFPGFDFEGENLIKSGQIVCKNKLRSGKGEIFNNRKHSEVTAD